MSTLTVTRSHGSSPRERRWLLGSLAIAAVVTTTLGAVGGATAAPPTFHDKFSETFTDVDICGVIGTLEVRGTQVITEGETNFTVRGQVRQVFTANDTGRTVTLRAAGQFTSQVVEGDTTLTFTETWRGLPEQISGRGPGGTVLRDAGIITIVTTIDLATGVITSDVVLVRGPHPEADSGFTLFCDAFLAALNG